MNSSRKWLAALLLLCAGVALATLFATFPGLPGSPYPSSGVTDAGRESAAISSFNNDSHDSTPQVGDEILAVYSDGWSQKFLITAIINGVVTNVEANAGSLQFNGNSNAHDAYTDQAGSCGGTYSPRYRDYEVIVNGESSYGHEFLYMAYEPNC